MKKSVTILVVVLLACSASAAWLDDDFDDGVVDTSLWEIGGSPGEVWESGTTLYHDDADSAAPRPYIKSRADNGYSWTAGTLILEWDNGGRYAGLFNSDGWLLVRKDITGGYWSLGVFGTNHTVYDFYLDTDDWYWEVDFDNTAGTVDFRGRKDASTSWDIERSYTYSSSSAFTFETAAYNTQAEFDRVAVVPEPMTIALLSIGFLGLRKRK